MDVLYIVLTHGTLKTQQASANEPILYASPSCCAIFKLSKAHPHTHSCTHVTHARTHTLMRTHTWHAHTRTLMHVYTHTHVCVHTHTHTHPVHSGTHLPKHGERLVAIFCADCIQPEYSLLHMDLHTSSQFSYTICFVFV